MAEAMKARYAVYRGFLKFSLWMGNLRGKYQWGIIIGFFVVVRIIRSIAASYPSFQPFLYPLIALIVLFAFSTWIIGPVSNLFLRLNKYGKHLLTRAQVISANFVGISVLILVVAAILYGITRQQYYIVLGIFGLSMMVPLSVMLSSARSKKVLVTYTIVLAATGIAGFITGIITSEVFNIFVFAYLIGFMLFQWVANFLLIRESNG
jgi:hypothetical protein